MLRAALLTVVPCIAFACLPMRTPGGGIPVTPTCEQTYHSSSQAPPAPEIPDMDSICYTPMDTTTRFDVLGRTTVQTRRGCEYLCNRLTKCIAFSFKDAGLTSSCALLSAASNSGSCAQPTTIYNKQTAGCAPRTDIAAEFGNDPCVSQVVPAAFHGVGTQPNNPICDVRGANSDLYIIRAIDEMGNRITLDNERLNTIQPVGNMWEYQFLEGGTVKSRVKIVAAVCALADDRCPCKPLGLAVDPSKTPPITPAKTDVENPCSGSPQMQLVIDEPKSGRIDRANAMTLADTAKAIVQCKAGMWIVWKQSTMTSWGVTKFGCYNP